MSGRRTITIFAEPTPDEIRRWAEIALRNTSIDVLDHVLFEDFKDGLPALAAPFCEDTARLYDAAHDMRSAVCALGTIGDGWCFCSCDRDPGKDLHEPECRELRAAIAKAEGRA